jgi:hypothetical protein
MPANFLDLVKRGNKVMVRNKVREPIREFTQRRIRKIAEKRSIRTYLEIGVENGWTFNSVDIEYKDAVDPRFGFDYSTIATEKVRFFETTSDDFFRNIYALEYYDLIFIDGLHTFEQAFRDFCSSLSYAHKNTVWIIDDTVPNDIFSAWPEQKRAVAARLAMLKNADRSWHGDVFKVVFAIHDFFPTLSYATVVDSGNPQTFVWRSPRKNFNPLFNSLEKISRLNWFDLEENEYILQKVTEDEVINRIG